MQITINIPDDLAPAVLRLLENKEEPNDDGRSDCRIREECKLSIPDFVRANALALSFQNQMETVLYNSSWLIANYTDWPGESARYWSQRHQEWMINPGLATVFTWAERESLNLPMNGQWKMK